MITIYINVKATIARILTNSIVTNTTSTTTTFNYKLACLLVPFRQGYTITHN